MRYFVAVAEELNFGRAAGRLFIAQPSLSKQIRRLEDLVGVTLLERSTHHVALTVAGEAFLEAARRTLESAEAAVGAARRAGGVEGERLVLGCAVCAAADLLLPIYRAFAEAHPAVSVEARHFDFADPWAGLKAGSVRAAFVWLPAEVLAAGGRFGHVPLLEDCQVAAMPDDHPLAASSALSLGDLAGERRLPIMPPFPDDDPWPARTGAGGRPRFVSYEEYFAAVLGGHGVGIVPASAGRQYGLPGMSFVPLEDLPLRTAALAWREPLDDLPAALGGFVDFVKGVAARPRHDSPSGKTEPVLPAPPR